jgi:hypothetical protein
VKLAQPGRAKQHPGSVRDNIGTRIALRSIRATIQRMTAASATSVRFDKHAMWVDLTDGRTLGIPLAWFPRLLHASPAERMRVELSRIGLHWETLDEDISIAGLLAGRGERFSFINIKSCRIVIPVSKTSLILLASCPVRGRF